MKLAIMQPYFFPYIGYFDLIHNVDVFMVYDTVQYIRSGWINRNRVLQKEGTGWQYIVVPIERAPLETSIGAIRAHRTGEWKSRILGQLSHYRKHAPYAVETIGFVNDCLETDEGSISRLNTGILKRCADLLQIRFEYGFCSELNIKLDPGCSAEERVLSLCDFLGASEYVNLPGGRSLYHEENFSRRNIKLTFRDLPAWTYCTAPYDFETNLSIVDSLMWNTPHTIREYLRLHQSV